MDPLDRTPALLLRTTDATVLAAELRGFFLAPLGHEGRGPAVIDDALIEFVRLLEQPITRGRARILARP